MNWIKSEFSSGNSNCVELSRQGDIVFVRDSNQADEVVCFSVEDAKIFVDGAKAGNFDGLLA